MRTGIIVARFQTSYLHTGHMKLINYVKELNERVIIFIGTSPARLTFNNPLSFEIRKIMVNEAFPSVEVFALPDHKSDEQWNDNLDTRIAEICPNEKDVVLYGDRESFINGYNGRYRKEFANVTVHGISATRIRMGHHMFAPDSKEGRAGVIWASEHKYPISYQTVDIAIVNSLKNQVLLGRKSGETKYRFIGGFVDPYDQTLELAAKREAREECGDIETDDYKYIGSFRINDWRYRKEKDKIMTALFVAEFIYGSVRAGDDIEEVKWFNIESLTADDFEPEHIILFDAFKKFMIK